ncbi:MAG: DUF3501 family protein [Rhodospirillaceae bacterium]|jgi:hypothetical protein|nr:DUF3501 family protein [Rhodospirillaceae bacterium]MBT5664220.1 DUF3501 family protein [Rhodospirillaceae bacterium]MBT5810737.1 DUF3501 family protein [Rhodospirillaceae bacterium]
MPAKTEITRNDILDTAAFAAIRKDKRREMSAIKANRRIEIGPVATSYFESFDTMWWQVQEMLYIEKGGDAQIDDELAAYNPLVPKGRELVCTVMFEIDDEKRRSAFLARLGGVEDTMFIRIGESEIHGVPEVDVDRTTADGKASSVQFIHFPFTAEQMTLFRAPCAQVLIGFSHRAYGHLAVMPDNARQSLSEDFIDP